MLLGFMDLKKATVVKRVNVDFPVWINERLARPSVQKHL
jgi:hypothetical protein